MTGRAAQCCRHRRICGAQLYKNKCLITRKMRLPIAYIKNSSPADDRCIAFCEGTLECLIDILTGRTQRLIAGACST